MNGVWQHPCGPGPEGHDISKDAYKCARCGKSLCEICQSDQHSTGQGHDLSNPRYWGV